MWRTSFTHLKEVFVQDLMEEYEELREEHYASLEERQYIPFQGPKCLLLACACILDKTKACVDQMHVPRASKSTSL
jgi:hypothetical protein